MKRRSRTARMGKHIHLAATGKIPWTSSSPAWVTPSGWATSGDSPCCATDTEGEASW